MGIPIGKVTPIPRGEYNAVRTYEQLDVITYMGSSYIAKKNGVGKTPTDDEYWMLLAKKGDDGSAAALDGHNSDPGAHGGVLGAIPQIKVYSLTIPVAGWQTDIGGGYFFELLNGVLREMHCVWVGLSLDSLETAVACGFSPIYEVLDGMLRFKTENVPETILTGEYTVVAESGSLVDGKFFNLELYAVGPEEIEELLSLLN